MVRYFDLESSLPFSPDVVWKYLTSPETYTLWLEGLIAVEPSAPLAVGSGIALSFSTRGRTSKVSFDVTALRPPSESPGQMAFEGRIGPEDWLLGTIRVHRVVGGSRVTANLELAQDHAFFSLFGDSVDDSLREGREQAVQMKLKRAAVLFRNVLEVQTADPYRGRA